MEATTAKSVTSARERGPGRYALCLQLRRRMASQHVPSVVT